MAAFIPSRRDPAVNATAMARVRDDKERESGDGFDGTWVAHPDLVPLATGIFDAVLGTAPHQKDRPLSPSPVSAERLRDLRIPGSTVTEAGVRLNVSVAIQYLDAWLAGNGAVAINDLMEDAATAEISRSQLWQWRTAGVTLADGTPFDADRYRSIRAEELAALGGVSGGVGRAGDAAELLDHLVLDDAFAEFLTLRAYELLD
jgi:malate synthase